MVSYALAVSNFVNDDEPDTIEEALTSIDKSKWQQAIEDELDSLKKNHTWDLVAKPKDIRVIGSK